MFPFEHLSHLADDPDCIHEAVAAEIRDSGITILDEIELGTLEMNRDGYFDSPGAETDLTQVIARRVYGGMIDAADFLRLYGNE